jgi:transposase-like protein
MANQQRCRVHWMRNALAHAPAKQRTAIAAMLKTIFAQESKAEAQAQWDTVGECHELCVSGLAHAGFRYGHALKRSSNRIAN